MGVRFIVYSQDILFDELAHTGFRIAYPVIDIEKSGGTTFLLAYWT